MPSILSFKLPTWLCLLLALCTWQSAAVAQPTRSASTPTEPGTASDSPETPAAAQTPEAIPQPLLPFGARLFMGNFLKQRNDGLNPDYIVTPGDRVAVNTWGTVEINDVFVVDGQGNIFLPGIGPIHLDGVRNADLTNVVRAQIGKVFLRNFGVYTNLLTAAPVAVFVTGQVERPGNYAGLPSDSVLFFLDQAGGIEPNTGSYRQIDVLRRGKKVASIDLYDFLLEGRLDQTQLEDGDTILVQQRGPTATLLGDVAAPTRLEFEGATLRGSEALKVVPQAAQATEVTVTGMRGDTAIARSLSIREFVELQLSDGDTVHFRAEGRPKTILVELEGEFLGPAVLSVKRGTRLQDLLNHVPVESDLSNTDAVHLKRVSVARAQKKAIDDSLFRLERTALLTLSQSNGEADIRVKEAQLMKEFINSARLIQPLGRVVTAQNGVQLNVLLEDGDVIVVPPKTNVVHVAGEIQMTQALAFRPGLTAGEYIELAGGYSDRGDDDRVLVLHASAEVSVGSPDMMIHAGDEIIVPPRVDHKRLQNTMDVVQIVYQIAVAAGVALSPVIAATN